MKNSGWLILVIILTVVVIILLILWIIALQNSAGCTCFGNYGVKTNTDGIELRLCGTNSNAPCLFRKNSIADCELECENLKTICNSFSFDSTRGLMKIIDNSNTFDSPSSNIFVRQ